MYPPSSSKSTAQDGGDADVNPYESPAGATRDFSSLGSQTHHHPRQPHSPQQQQHNPNFTGHYFPGEPSSLGFDSGGASSSSLFRHRSSPAGFYDQHLPTDPNGFPLGQPNGGYGRGGGGGGGGGGERGPSRLKSEMRFSESSSHQEHKSLRQISDVEAAAAINNVASSSMSFGNNNNWDNSSSNISFTIGEPGKQPKNTDFFTLETQYSMPQTTLEMARMESLMNIPEDSVPFRLRAKRGQATHPRSIAERERRTRISGRLKKLQELVPNMDKQTSYADMLDLAVEHIRGLQQQVESLEKVTEKCTCGACTKR